jgi:hypothetical protein
VIGDEWGLYRAGDGVRVAALVVYDWDFPWVNAKVRALDGLSGLLPLFAEEVARLEDVDGDVGGWDRAYEAVRAAVWLRDPEGRDVPEFLLHLEGDEAWWRWNDEPFEE